MQGVCRRRKREIERKRKKGEKYRKREKREREIKRERELTINIVKRHEGPIYRAAGWPCGSKVLLKLKCNKSFKSFTKMFKKQFNNIIL